MYKIGPIIKKVRESRGITQKEFANRLGLKNTTVNNWEKGITRPDADTLAEICKVLDVSADVLLDIKPKNESNVFPFSIDEPNPIDEMSQEIFEKRKILFSKSAKATKEDLEKMIKIFDAMFGEDE